MIDLIYIIYFIDLLVAIKCLSIYALVIIVIGSFILYAVYDCNRYINSSISNEVKNFANSHKRKLYIITCLSVIALVFIPSERNMYIMSGLYVGNEVVTTISDNETFKKVEILLNQKLDELIQDNE